MPLPPFSLQVVARDVDFEMDGGDDVGGIRCGDGDKMDSSWDDIVVSSAL